MRVLITGAAGFVGSHTVEWFLETTDFEIVGIDSFRHLGDSSRLKSVPEHKRDRVSFLCHDLNAPISKRAKDDIGNIDYIINCASISHVDTSIEDPVFVWDNNTRIIGNILAYAREIKVKKFIQCSTDEVFGPAPAGCCYKEEEVHRPSNPYSASKAAQDALCFSFWRTYNMPICVTHAMNMIGVKQDPEKYLPRIISRILKGETITVHGTPGNIGSRMYLDARNLADGWRHLLQNIPFSRYSEDPSGDMPRYNIAGLEEIDNLELAQRCAKLLPTYTLAYHFEDFHKLRPGHDLRYALDSSKILATGWKPPISLEQTIQEVVDHLLSHPEWREEPTQ